jgi:hypothetical protein
MEAMITSWMVWPIFNIFNYSLVPVRLQVLAGKFIAAFRICYVSYLNASPDDIEIGEASN